MLVPIKRWPSIRASRSVNSKTALADRRNVAPIAVSEVTVDLVVELGSPHFGEGETSPLRLSDVWVWDGDATPRIQES